MQCPNCEFNNPEGMKFCGQCATVLPQETSSSKALVSRSILAERSALEAERRQVTVIFCDLVGSTSLSEQLDPEELREVIGAYQKICAQVVNRFDGYIARFIGDGILIYFGYPVAHEDDAHRAVLVGLGIVEALQQANTRWQQTLQVRIGIHTGLVVAGDIGEGTYRDPKAIVGSTPNIASRVQAMAEPDAVVITSATYRLIQGFFTCLALGPQQLRGILSAVQVYRVLGKKEVGNRFEVAITTGLTPLIGRENEVSLLLEYWKRVKTGEGQVVLVSGEPGIGKSRLVQTMKEQLQGEGQRSLECCGSLYHQNTPFYPLIDLLQRTLEIRREDSPEKKLKNLERSLRLYGPSPSEALPLFASLLSLPLPDRYLPLYQTPERQKQQIREVFLSWLLQTVEEQPVRFVMEDLHWVDPSTLDVLSLLIERAPTIRILILLTSRSEYSTPWATSPYLTHLTLSRLSHKQVYEIIKKITGGKALPAEVTRQIVTKTDGVPLFVEELTKMVLESGLLRGEEYRYELTDSLPPLAIPATLQDSLMARLDRLGSSKEVAQLGATLGREFSYELLQAVSWLNETELQQQLDQLVHAELLYQQGVPPRARYFFKHVLIQEAAYQSLLRSKRQQYHRKIVQVLEEHSAETRETEPELLAHHYTHAGLIEQAIPYWHKAGRKAVESSAHIEAIIHFRKALELLNTLPDTGERAQQELPLQIAVGGPLIATKGYGSPEVEKVYARALELCNQLGTPPRLLQVLLGLEAFYFMRGELPTARRLAERCLLLAQQTEDPARLLQAHWTLGQVLFHLAEFTTALKHVEQGLRLYSPRHHSARALQDPGVMCFSYVAMTLWCLGYPDQALKKSREMLILAQELSHPFTLAFALGTAATVHLTCGEENTVQDLTETMIALCMEQEFPVWLAYGTVLQSWAQARLEQGGDEVARMNQGIAAWRATGAEVSRTFLLALLAETSEKTGQIEVGLSVVKEALSGVQKNEEHYYEAELYRLKGELTLQCQIYHHGKSRVGSESRLQRQAEHCFLRAIDTARSQNAKSWELRAVMSLSRLWQQQGKKREARMLLAETYRWFTEGFDTADLRAARALLEQLGVRDGVKV